MPGKKKRPNGEGSIARRKDGRYEGRYTVQTASGPKRRAVYGKSRAEAAEKLARAIAERDAGTLPEIPARDVTLGQYLEAYLADAAGRVRPKTHRRYEDLANLHLIPWIGKKKLRTLSPGQLRALYAGMLEAGYAPRTVGHAHVLLKQVLRQAMADGLLPRNVAEAVRPPGGGGREINPLAASEVGRLFRAASGSRYEALYVLAVTAGLRRGELLGLRWEDIDLNAGTLQVRRTLQRGEMLPPKTPRSRRSVQLSQRAVFALSGHRDRQVAEKAERGGSWAEKGLVFPNAAGNFTCGDNLCSRHFRPLLREAGLPDIRFHDLRHTCATLLLSRNIHPKIVSEMLGHANISITLDIYSHVIPGMGEAAAGAMDDALDDRPASGGIPSTAAPEEPEAEEGARGEPLPNSGNDVGT